MRRLKNGVPIGDLAVLPLFFFLCFGLSSRETADSSVTCNPSVLHSANKQHKQHKHTYPFGENVARLSSHRWDG